MSGKLVLVTGVTGFIAGEVANQFLAAGYRVRGTTRGEKVKELGETIKVPGLEFVRVDDIASSDLTEALKDVYAVIHVASPLPGRTNAEDTLRSAEQGTLHVLEATAKAGIEKIVVTSSFGAIMDPSLVPGFHGLTFNGSEWPELTREDVKAKEDNNYYVYFASKVFAERAVWKFAKEHPQLDVATILPGFVYGPYAKHFPFPKPQGLGTNGFIYYLMTGAKPPTCPPVVVDVRDVAKAHVAALNVPRHAELEHKRYLVVGGNLTWKEAVAHFNKVRPDFKTTEQDDLPGPASTYDTTKTQKELGIQFIKPEQTVVDAADSLLEAQKTWTA